MKRYEHYWWQCKGEYYPSRIAVVDCDQWKPSQRRTACYSVAHCELLHGLPSVVAGQVADNPAGLWDLLARFVVSKENTWVIMPNGGVILEAIGFWERLENGHISLHGKDWREGRNRTTCGEANADGICVIEDPPTIILCGIRNRSGKLLFLDCRNYGIDGDKLGGDCVTRSRRLLGGICDCLRALRQDRPTSIRCSAASQAVQSLRTHWCVRGLHCTNHIESLRLARDSYYSGRCEAYRIGQVREKLYHLDVRNMYPSLCLTLPVAVSLRRYHADEQGATRVVRDRPEACIAHVEIRSDCPKYPVKRCGLTVYPTGRFTTVIAAPELLKGIRSGEVARIFSAAEYAIEPVLAGFYRYWLDKLSVARQEGKEILQQFIKALMNSLPGKFCEPGRRWIPIPFSGRVEPYDEWYGNGPDGELVRYRQIAWYTQREEIYGESYQSIPSVGSWVTSAGRIRLWDYIETAGRANVRYVDTDSLIVGQAGFDSLLRAGFISEGKVGYLRLIGTSRECSIYGIRDYRFGDTVRCSGVRKGEIKGSESRAQYWERMRIKTEIAMGRRPGSGTGSGRLEVVEPYRHGIVSPDGSVSPFMLGV